MKELSKPIEKKVPTGQTMVAIAPTQAAESAAASWVQSAKAEATASVQMTPSLRVSDYA